MIDRPHTAQELYVYARETPSVLRNLERTFATLDKHADLDTEKAVKLLLTNVKSAAQLYVQAKGLPLRWYQVFPECEREGCAGLFLRMYDCRDIKGVMRDG